VNVPGGVLVVELLVDRPADPVRVPRYWEFAAPRGTRPDPELGLSSADRSPMSTG